MENYLAKEVAPEAPSKSVFLTIILTSIALIVALVIALFAVTNKDDVPKISDIQGAASASQAEVVSYDWKRFKENECIAGVGPDGIAKTAKEVSCYDAHDAIVIGKEIVPRASKYTPYPAKEYLEDIAWEICNNAALEPRETANHPVYKDWGRAVYVPSERDWTDGNNSVVCLFQTPNPASPPQSSWT